MKKTLKALPEILIRKQLADYLQIIVEGRFRDNLIDE